MRVLREHPQFAVFFAGQAVSLVGSWMTRVALGWLVYRLTGSVMMLALVAFAGQAPVSLFALLGGALVDRWNRRHVLLVSKLVAMLLSASLATLTLASAASIPWLLVLAALQGLQTAVDMPARQALLPELVRRTEDLPAAIALNSSMVHGARFLGPFTAGWVIAHFGEGFCFAIDALSYVPVLGALLLLRLEPVPSSPRAKLADSLRAGYRYVVDHPKVHGPLLLLAAVSVSGWSYSVLLPDFVAKGLRLGVTTLGHLMAASGAGALAAAVWLAQRTGSRSERLLGLTAGAVGAALLGLSLSFSSWLAAALLAIVGAGMMLLLALCNTALQVYVPNALRGRVMGFFTLATFGTLPLGNLLAGATASHFGSRVTLALSGSVTLLAALCFVLCRGRELSAHPSQRAKGT